ncbi:MAG: 3-hydroxylacyl-ACP dehydratase [bacterium]|nr:3-hydroxylacyl-ACP dehydratase [bacterium]
MKNTLLKNFYTEISSTFSETNQQEFSSIIKLDPSHPVYQGHFEQVPIAPGVCLTQIIKEIVMEKYQKELIMTSGDNIKFLILINPTQQNEFSISFSVKEINHVLEVSANYSANGQSYMKFKGKFTPRS